MKFNRTTITLVFLCIGLTTTVYLTQIKPEGFNLENQETTQNEVTKIFPFQTEDIQQITIDINQDVIKFQRKDEPNSPWQMTQPETLLANDGAIAFLVNLFPQAEKKLEISPDVEKKKEYGLLESSPTIAVTLHNEDRYHMILGNANFDDTQIYAQIKFPASIQAQSSIFLVSKSFQYAIERDFGEWKQE